MNALLRKSVSVGLSIGGCIAALLIFPSASRAQVYDTSTGTDALSHDTGGYNSAFGYGSLYLNSTGNFNTAIGFDSLLSNTTGLDNTAIGNNTLHTNSTGNYNTGSGANALYSNTTGSSNTANGFNSLYFNTTGTQNTSIGNGSMYSNTTGSYNTAAGYKALISNTTGVDNTATGNGALYSNTSGNYNVANGVGALLLNTMGNYNTANGYDSLSANTTGSYNISLGYDAGSEVTTGNYNIDIGSKGASSDLGVIRLGTAGNQTAAFIAGINGVTVTGGAEVFIDSSGQLGTIKSSRRFKFDIHDMGALSDRLMDLRPVTFRYKEAARDGTHPIQYGLIAEEVAKVYPNLVQYDKQGKPFTVYYNLLTPMMLSDLQKAHHQLTAQQAEFGSLKATVQSQASTLQKQTAMLQTQSSAMGSLRSTVQMLLAFAACFVLAAAVGVAHVVADRTRRNTAKAALPVIGCAA